MTPSTGSSTATDGGVARVGKKSAMPTVSQQPARKPPATGNISGRSSSMPARTMLDRKASIQSVGRSATGLWRRFPSFKRETPTDPSLRRIQPEEGAPVPRGEPVTCSFEEIMKLILPRDNPPEFDCLDSYVIVRGVHEKLWRMEARRLLDIVKSSETPLQFGSDDQFQRGDEDGYRELSKCCQKILTAISICLLDNECINSEYCSQLTNKAKLSKLIRQATLRQSTSDASDANQKAENGSLDAIFCLVNYISAVLARLITQTSPGFYWQCNVLAVLIKRVTKIKVLLGDLHAYSAVAVRSGESALDRARESGPIPDSVVDEEEECEEILRMIEANEKAGLASMEEREIAQYCIKQNKFRAGIDSALRFILMNMRFTNRSGLPATTFELCAVAYETGFEGFKTLLFQDRDLEYSATSNLDTLNMAHSAFGILSQTVSHLKNTHAKEGPPEPSELRTYIEWAYLGSENSEDDHESGLDLAHRKEKPLQLRTMEDIITVMVPLFTTCPIFLSEFSDFRSIIALSGSIRDDVQPYEEGHFSAFFRMYTSDFHNNMDQREVLHLSEALESGFFSRYSLMSGSSGIREYMHRHSPHHDSRVLPDDAKITKTIRKFDEFTQEMDKWVIDESSVTVACGWYVWPIIALAAILAGGGLAIGFSVGGRISGVDPSNLATYLWVVAAFVMLVGKSVHVKEWTWNDFLHRRVRCCSVSELHAITGMNEQLIIAKLLHDECGGSVLKIRGPYNSVFLRRSTEGFSIDSPIETGTLLLSGLTMLKVVTPRGHALVCLDARRGADLRIVYHQSDQSREHLVCQDINPQHKRTRGTAGDEIRLPLMRSKTLKWKRVQGIYKVRGARFT